MIRIVLRVGDGVSSRQFWKLKREDGPSQDFIDIRRKVGNQIIRAYLLKPLFEQNKVVKIKAVLRGPKDEFKDFANFLVVKAKCGKNDFEILAEAGVYENLRIVGTNSKIIANLSPEAIVKSFSEALQDPKLHKTSLILSNDSKVQAK